MSAHFYLDAEKHLVKVRFDSEVTVQDVLQYLESLKSNPLFDPNFDELVDLTDVTSSEVDFQSAMRLAHSADPFSWKARRAFVAARPAIFGIVRMYELARGEDGSIAAFHTIGEAIHWLDRSHSRNAKAERCPYCIVGDDFRRMIPESAGWFICVKCCHRVAPEKPQFKCFCLNCEKLTRVV
jgi:hypothetical protein